MIFVKRIIKFLLVILVIIFGILYFNNYLDQKYINETKNMTDEDLETVTKVISLAREKIGLQYVWGGKGEILTDERLNELINMYGESYYPLDSSKYIGFQAFDCSGLTYWTYKSVTGINIGYSTLHQKEIMSGYTVDYSNLQPGDLIYTPGHVVMYIGKNKVIQSANPSEYPLGGVKESFIFPYKNGEIYRPLDFLKANS